MSSIRTRLAGGFRVASTILAVNLLLVLGTAAGAEDAAEAGAANAPKIGAGSKYDPTMVQCEMVYNLKGWSFVYKTSKGEAHITCSNGQSAYVTIQLNAGGLTAGKSEIIGGKGTFSEVRDMSELYGAYTTAGAHAGASKTSAAAVVTKGEVSLTLVGTGRGIDLGVDIGKFEITPK